MDMHVRSKDPYTRLGVRVRQLVMCVCVWEESVRHYVCGGGGKKQLGGQVPSGNPADLEHYSFKLLLDWCMGCVFVLSSTNYLHLYLFLLCVIPWYFFVCYVNYVLCSLCCGLREGARYYMFRICCRIIADPSSICLLLVSILVWCTSVCVVFLLCGGSVFVFVYIWI